MLIYEKDNKLNISFENNIENPDFEISKNEVNLGSADVVSTGSSGVFIVRVNDDVLDKTWQEIYDAALTTPVFLIDSSDTNYVTQCVLNIVDSGKGFSVSFYQDGILRNFIAQSADEYPVYDS